jgi:hypothetical protein
MAGYELAQLNIALVKYPLDSPLMAEFVANLDRINALADASPGFVWRLPADDAEPNPFGATTLPNLSVWADMAALRAYAYKSAHAAFIGRRKEWFERLTEAHLVLWWVPRGWRPTLGEAAGRLARVRRDGPTAEAFTFRQPFMPPGVVEPLTPHHPNNRKTT